MQKYVVLEKAVGQTPLQLIREYKKVNPELGRLPMAYAGRLDPMATGAMLILIGEECKSQEKYHALDKEYEFTVLFGTASDSGDVLGRLTWEENVTNIKTDELDYVCKSLVGELKLPYPKFSSKTVNGKPLHIWTLEGRLSEIEIPIAETTLYKLEVLRTYKKTAEEIFQTAMDKIESIPLVTEESKALGRDFRRDDIRLDWKLWLERHKGREFVLADLIAVTGSGTYIRSLSEEIGKRLLCKSLAFSIHRSKIGRYKKLPFGLGFWSKIF